MDNNKLKENKIIKVQIQGGRNDGSNSPVSLIFKLKKDVSVVLTDSGVEDIKALFDEIFDAMIQDKKYLIFELDDGGKTDLYHDVADQIINQLNSEINQSKNNIERIWQLTNVDHYLEKKDKI